MQWVRQHTAADPDASSVRKVGWRLAALTVALVSVLLLTSGVLVYVTTQGALLKSLENTLQSRSLNPPACVLRMLGTVDSGGVLGADPFYRPCSPQDTQGVTYTVFDLSLTVRGTFPQGDAPITDKALARDVLVTQSATGYVQETNDNRSYLLYSVPLVQQQNAQIIGVVQTSISEEQYLDNLASLRRELLTISIFGILATAGISVLLARRALKPIQLSLRRQRDFVADAAHELRTPLTIMRTAAELGLAEETIAEQQRALEQTLDQNNHLTRLVENLSLLARADSGALAVERSPINFSELVQDSVAAVEMLAEDRNVRLSGQSQPGITVMGDEGRLRQLLLILLDNALKYTPEGGEVTVKLEAQGGAARLQVRDTGPGIDPKDLPRLFERFYRADRARTGDGTGLGLAIGRWIVDVHHGKIAAANAPGGGALFTVTLPAGR